MDNTALHSLLLLSDSALPLGSFAFSSGLESYLAHQKQQNPSSTSLQNTSLSNFDHFLDLSLESLASTALPYVLDAFDDAEHLADLDNDFDASTACTVARRASVAQGKALVQLWERALGVAIDDASLYTSAQQSRRHLTAFIATLKHTRKDGDGLQSNAHFAPLFGAVCSALSLSADETAYLFLLNQAKAVLSAAVRASVMGPYQSHAILASAKLQGRIRKYAGDERERLVKDAGVTVPMMDLWAGRHELLYSRIFNS